MAATTRALVFRDLEYSLSQEVQIRDQSPGGGGGCSAVCVPRWRQLCCAQSAARIMIPTTLCYEVGLEWLRVATRTALIAAYAPSSLVTSSISRRRRPPRRTRNRPSPRLPYRRGAWCTPCRPQSPPRPRRHLNTPTVSVGRGGLLMNARSEWDTFCRLFLFARLVPFRTSVKTCWTCGAWRPGQNPRHALLRCVW